MKKLMTMCLLAALLCAACFGAQAATEPNSKTIEESFSYDYDTLKIQVDRWCYAFNNTECRFFVVNVWTQSPQQLATAFAGEEYTKDTVEATSEIAARHDAVIAINGDYYNFKDKNGTVIRNGVLYRDPDSDRDHLLIDRDGKFTAVFRDDYQAGMGQTWLDQGVVQCFTFGPVLVNDGAAVELPTKYYISTKDIQREPRAAIGQVDENHYVLIIADGRREGWSDKGMTLQEMQKVFVEQGCRVAYNLDGGGSATLIINGEKINRSSGSRERNVSDIIYFVK